MVNIVTAAEVYDLAGLSVDHELVSKAQLVISTAAGFPLSDAAAFEALALRDKRALTTAVVWQVVYLDQHPERFGGEHPGNVQAAAANGASVTFRGDDDGTVAPLAQRELDSLTWRSQPVTIRTLRPYRRDGQGRRWVSPTESDPPASYVNRGPQPDPWVPL